MVPGLESYQQKQFFFLSCTLTQAVFFEVNANHCKVVGNLCLAMNETSTWHLYEENRVLEGTESQDRARLHSGKFCSLWLISSQAYAC